MNKKGLVGIAKFSIILITLVIVGVFIVNYVLPTLAGDTTSIWTVDENGNLKQDFELGESIYILGEGFLSDSSVNVDITRPDSVVDSGTTDTTSSGEFVYEYVLDEFSAMEGEYLVSVFDGVNSEITNFTDNGQPGAIWTTKNDCGDVTQDVNHYDVGDHVYINGAGFNAGTYPWYIMGLGGSCDSGVKVALGNVIIGSSGAFCFDAYTVLSGDCGVYQVKVNDVKEDNYQVNDYCIQWSTQVSCQGHSCQWCAACQWPQTPVKSNQWLQNRCVVPGADCGWHCEMGYCEAECSVDTDCSCPQDFCNDTTLVDYPGYGECVDCPKSCYCLDGEGQGEACSPTLYPDHPDCIAALEHTECIDGSCALVQGPGQDECTVDDDCWHNECNYDTRECEALPLPGTDCCNVFDDCVHKECVGELCQVVDSPGIDLCTNDFDCQVPTHTECQDGYCVVAVGGGDNQCSIDGDCRHNVCDYQLEQCVEVMEPGIDECTTWEDCECIPDIEVDKWAYPSSFSICSYTTVTLNVTGAGCPQTIHFPIDLMFVMDRSGSMDDLCSCTNINTCTGCVGTCKICDAKAAAKSFVDLMSPSLDQSGLGSFSNSATLDQGLTFNQLTVKNAIDALITGGQTAIGSGISVANTELINNGRTNSVWVEILLSNGQENQGSNPLDRANEAASAGIIIYTIGLGSTVNQALLQQIAAITGGKYYFAPSSSDLQQIYDEISEEILNIAGVNVVITDYIPLHAQYVSGSLSSNPPDDCSYDAGTKTINCNLGTMSIGESYLITFDLEFTESGTLTTNIYPNSKVTFIDFESNPQSRPFPLTQVEVIPCDDGLYCNGVEYCENDQCMQGTPVSCSYLDDQCNLGVCDEGLDKCVKNPKPYSTQCDNGLYCDGEDHCDGLGECVSLGPPIDCSYLNDICQEGMCDEGKDACVPDYTKFPLSTPCEADDDLCTIDHCDGSGTCVKDYDVDCSYLDDDYCLDDEIWHDEGYCDPSDGQCYADSDPVKDCYYYSEYCDDNKRMSDTGFCNEDTTPFCDYTTAKLEDCDDYNLDYCSDLYHWVHQTGTCIEDTGTLCALASSTGDCRDDLWCNGQETCSETPDVHCEAGTPVDCSGNDISGISECYYDPDLKDETFDWRDPFTSQCVEEGGNDGHCTTGDKTIYHACADDDDTDGVLYYDGKTRTCDAECDGSGTECQDKCVGDVWYYDGDCDLGDCYCDYDTYNCNVEDGCYVFGDGCEDRDYFCEIEGCDYTYSNRNTDYHDPYLQYCSNSEVREHRTLHDFYCDGNCQDHTSWVDDHLIKDCDDNDGWYNTSETKWVDHPSDPCMEIEQQKQKYRDYSCYEDTKVDCDFKETDERWVNTGKEREKEDITGPVTYNLKIAMHCNVLNITAIVEDLCSNVEEAEFFFDVCPADTVRGTPMSPTDGTFDEKQEDVYKDGVDVKYLGLTDGRHNLFVRGKDEEGNWGACAVFGFDVDILPPHRVERELTPQMACGNDVTVTALICEPIGFNESFICDAEYFLDDFNAGNGFGFPMEPIDGFWADDYCEWVTGTIDVSPLTEGTHYVKLHGMDCYCNWGKLNLPPLWFIKDTTAPTTTKTVYQPKVECGYDYDGENDVEECWYVTQNTEIDLNAEDYNPGDDEYSGNPDLGGYVNVYCKFRWKENWEDDWSAWTAPQLCDAPFTFEEDSIHEIEYWSVDWCGNEEDHHFEIDIVDTKPPETTKKINGPQYYDEIDEKLYIDGVTTIELKCVDPEPHPVDCAQIYYRYRVDEGEGWGEWIKWTLYTGPFSFPEESKHELEYYCIDILANEETHKFEIDYVDKTPPVTEKTYGTPFYTDGVSKWITSQTPITLTADDGDSIHSSGVAVTLWRNTLVDDRYCSGEWDCQNAGGSGVWNTYEGPFYKPEESCHLIEYYSVDNVEKTEEVKKQCVYVEDTAPKIYKDISGPQRECTPDEIANYGYPDYGCYYIIQQSKIYLGCVDEGDHPVDDVVLYYRDYLLETTPPAFTPVPGGFVEIMKKEDSEHILEFYCEDALGNTDGMHVEIDIVDTQPPVSQKQLGDPKHACTQQEIETYYPQMSNPTDGCYFINQSTPITITCQDLDPHPVGNVKIRYRDYLVGEEPPAFTEVLDDHVEFTKDRDCAHILEWYCIDELGNEEDLHVEYDIVDSQPPETTKKINGPEYWEKDKHFIDGVTEIELTCVDPEPHPVGPEKILYRYRVNGGDWTGWFTYTGPFKFPEESEHELEYYCVDILGNEEQHHVQYHYVDHTPPVTEKTYGTPFYTDGVSKWITSQTPITLTADDGDSIHSSGVAVTLWRNTLVDDRYCSGEWDCQNAGGSGVWNTYEGPFYKPEESCHLIEYYSVDNVEKTEVVKKQCVYVENTAPETTKKIGDPKVECSLDDWFYYGEPKDGCWYITQETLISLSCVDPTPHPVDDVVLYYRDYLLGEEPPTYTTVPGGYVEFTKDKDCVHVLEWYCVDALGNTEGKHYEIDIVDTKPPVLNKNVGDPKVDCDDYEIPGEIEDCDYYITQETEITFDCYDPDPHPVDDVEIWFRYRYKMYPEDPWSGWVGPIEYTKAFKFPEDSIHEIEYWCVDALGNRVDSVELDVVDTEEPETVKTISEPKWFDELNEWWFVNDYTIFELEGLDPEPHPVDFTTTMCRYSFKCHYESEWEPITDWGVCEDPFSFDEEGMYKLEYYSYDLLDNTEETKVEIDIVDKTPPHVLILKPVDGWYHDGGDIPIVAVSYDEGNCAPPGSIVECNAYLVDILPEFMIVELESHMHYDEEAMECVGYATVPDPSGLPDGIVFLVVEAVDGSGNAKNSIEEILEAYDEGYPDEVMDLLLNWNLPRIGIDNHPADVIIVEPEEDTVIHEENLYIEADINDGDGIVTSGIKNGEPCPVRIADVDIGNIYYSDSTDKCSGTLPIPPTLPNGYQPLEVSITDNAGTTGSGMVYVTVDTKPPEKDVLSPVAGGYYSAGLPINVSVTDDGIGVDDSTVRFRISDDNYCLDNDPGSFNCAGSYDTGWITLDNSEKPIYKYLFDTSGLEEGLKYYLNIWACDQLADVPDYKVKQLKAEEFKHCVDPILYFGIDRTPPKGPTNVIIDGNLITWDPATDLSGIKHYKIYHNGVLFDTTTKTSYNVGDPTGEWGVRAVDNSNPPNEGNLVIAQPPAQPSPPPSGGGGGAFFGGGPSPPEEEEEVGVGEPEEEPEEEEEVGEEVTEGAVIEEVEEEQVALPTGLFLLTPTDILMGLASGLAIGLLLIFLFRRKKKSVKRK